MDISNIASPEMISNNTSPLLNYTQKNKNNNSHVGVHVLSAEERICPNFKCSYSSVNQNITVNITYLQN